MTHWVGTSWKMSTTIAGGLEFVEELRPFVADLDERIQPFVIPSFTALRDVKRALADTRVMVGAQNMHWAESGAWTGEVSPLQLSECEIDMVELGHSERREHFGETDHTVGLKVEAAIRFGFVPLICVGETLDERDAGRADEVLIAQTEGALRALDDTQRVAEILFAYEPVWAIGERGTAASSDYADRRQQLIKQVAGTVLAAEPPVLYGGSVDAANAAELIACPHVDGLFVGRAAWTAAGFIDVLRASSAAI